MDGLDIALPVVALSSLVALLGPQASAERALGVRRLRSVDSEGHVVHKLLRLLQASDNDAAEYELGKLANDPALQAWQPWLIDALQTRRRRIRTERHRFPNDRQVAAALGGGPPANVHDLAALLGELLADVERDLRDREGRQLDLFWHDPNPNKRRRPRRENECRNRLHAKLQPRLKALGISLSLETQHADDTRADLGLCWAATGCELRLPVEIKCEDHAKVWAAWADQLEGYAAHPDAGGVGVYLVLWFGHAPLKAPNAPCRPINAHDMQVQLQALIPVPDRQRLLIVVLDLSLPARPRQQPARSQKRQSA